MVFLHKLQFSVFKSSWAKPAIALATCLAMLSLALPCQAQESNQPNVAQQRVFAPEGLVRLTHFRDTFSNRGVFFGGAPKSVERIAPTLVESKQVRKEIAALEVAVEQEPQNTQLLLKLAEFKTNIGQRREAIILLHRVQEIDKDSVAAHVALCDAWLDLDDLDRAYRHAEEAIELNRNDAAGFKARAVVRHQLQLTDLAMLDIDQAIALSPNDAEAYATRSIYLMSFGQNRLAVETADRALSLEPENSLALQVRSKLYYAAGDLDEAYRLSKSALGLYPDDMTLLSLQIAVCSDLNRLTESLDHCDHILEGDPANIFTRRLRARLNAQLKNIDQVQDDCQKLQRLDDASMETALYVLQCYTLIDDMKKAKSAQQHAVAIAAEIHDPRFNAILQQMTADLQKKLRFLE